MPVGLRNHLEGPFEGASGPHVCAACINSKSPPPASSSRMQRWVSAAQEWTGWQKLYDDAGDWARLLPTFPAFLDNFTPQ